MHNFKSSQPNGKVFVMPSPEIFSSRRLGRLWILLRQREARFNGAAGGAFEAADAAGDVDGLIHFHAHRAAAAAEVAFHALLRVEPEMKQAEPGEEREESSERTQHPAP